MAARQRELATALSNSESRTTGWAHSLEEAIAAEILMLKRRRCVKKSNEHKQVPPTRAL
jgi:hypothetical protein